jgi:DNA-directed RNA polymerase specialized sigma24 family protein
MEFHNWVEERIQLLYEDAALFEYFKEVAFSADDPESRLIASEELNLAITLTNRCLKPKQAAAISLLATGKASNHADAARMAGITQTQLHRAIKWLKNQLESLAA